MYVSYISDRGWYLKSLQHVEDLAQKVSKCVASCFARCCGAAFELNRTWLLVLLHYRAPAPLKLFPNPRSSLHGKT